MSDKEAQQFGLALPRPERFKKMARKAASTRNVALDKRRVEFSQKQIKLEMLIGRMLEISAKMVKENDPEKRAELHAEHEKYYSLISLRGITGLYEAAGLLMDMVSVEFVDKNKKTGEKVYNRYSLANTTFDCLEQLESITELIEQQNDMLAHIGARMDAFPVPVKPKEPKPEERAPEDADAETTEGLTEDQIAAMQKVTEEDLDQEIGKKE